MNFFTRNACILALTVLALCVAPAVMAQQTKDPSGACTVESSGAWLNAQTGTFYCKPNSAGASAGTWTAVGIGVNGLYAAHAVYKFSVDGGVQGTITPVTNSVIPNHAIVFGVILNSTTALTSGGSATIAVGTSAGSSTTAFKGATAVASYSSNALLAGVPVFTVGSAVKMSASGSITITVATADLTAGVLDITVLYVMPSA